MSRLAQTRRIILWTGGLLLATFAICLLFITALAGNENMSRRLLRHAAGYAGIEIGNMSGALATGMKLENLRYSNGATEVHIGELDFDWEPWALAYGTARFRALNIDHVRIEHALAESAAAEEIKFPDIYLPLRISIDEAELRDLRLDYDGRAYTLDSIRLDAALGSTLSLNQLKLQAPSYELAAEGAIDGGYPYKAGLKLTWRYHLDSGVELAGAADISGDIERLEVEHALAAPGELKTSGHVVTGIGGAAPHAELRNRWNDLRLQRPLLPFAVDSSGELHIAGWLSGYRLQGRGKVAVESERIPPFGFSLDAAGNLAGLDTADLELETLGGTIAAAGAVRWTPGFEWRADIAAENIDLSSYHAQLPSGLQLSFQTEGARADARWRGRINDLRATGTAAGYPLRLRGETEFKGAAFSNSSLQLTVADNALTLKGGVNHSLDLQWELDAPRLPALWPGLEGAMKGKGRITGNRDSPRFQAGFTGKNLAYADYRIESLQAGLQTEKSRHILTLEAQEITLHGRTLSAFSLNARGDAAGHIIESRIQDEYLKASARAEGSYRESRWQGTLHSARWRPGNLPEWTLQKPVGIAFGSGSIRIEQACWSAEQARFCAQLASGGNSGIRGEVSLDSLPAELLDPWLPLAVKIEGKIGGTLTLNGPDWGKLTGNLELQSPTGRIGVRREGTPADYYGWEKAFLKAQLQDRKIGATAGLGFPGYGDAASTVSLNLDDRSLGGDISARFGNLAPLQTVITDLDGLQGQLRASVNIAGTLDDPRFSGSLLLDEASARIPRLGIQIQGLRFSAQSDNGSDIAFKGHAESGGGRLEIAGKLAYGAAPPLLEASIQGQAFQILRQPQVQASISPQLDITGRPHSIDVRGSVRIPFARIDIRETPESTVTVSDDVIIIDAEADSGTQQDNGIKLNADVRLILGDDVQFQGFGFNAGLEGELALNKAPGRPVATVGELRVRQGQYKAFGQKLEIDRGRLLFQGTYDNPGLDILAVRKTPEVTVSLEIGGTLASPRSRVFSDPPLPDSEAMAILLTGKPLGSASKSDANALVNAIAGLGLRKGQFITDEIARTFNLDEFRIKTESDVTASSLFIGKQISPRLFIRYIVGLFDQTSRIGLSYELSEQLRLEAESGWNQSMDLIYEIER